MKRITIFNGNPNTEDCDFEDYISELSSHLENDGSKVSIFRLRELRVQRCVGCYSCWVKTPGLCIYRDDVDLLFRSYINSDFVVYSTPIILGLISPILKNVNERMFPPVMHPLIKVENGRMQHLSRYEKYPRSCLLLGRTGDFGPGAVDMIHNIYSMPKYRRLLFTRTMESTTKEVSNEISSL